MKDVVTKWRRLPFPGRKPRISPVPITCVYMGAPVEEVIFPQQEKLNEPPS